MPASCCGLARGGYSDVHQGYESGRGIGIVGGTFLALSCRLSQVDFHRGLDGSAGGSGPGVLSQQLLLGCRISRNRLLVQPYSADRASGQHGPSVGDGGRNPVHDRVGGFEIEATAVHCLDYCSWSRKRVPMNQPLAPSARNKRILLVVSDDVRRDLRARVLRKLGADVECAADISEARSLWRADSYNLVLLDVIRDERNAEEFCTDIKAAKPPQAVAFLVGKPDYIAASPRVDGVSEAGDSNGHGAWGDVVASLFASACQGLSRRWGFQEAAWRIAAARSMKDPSRNQPRGYAKVSARDPAKPTVPSWAEAIAQHSIFASGTPPVVSVPPVVRSETVVPAEPDLHLEKIG